MSRYRKYIVGCFVILSVFLFTRFLFEPILCVYYWFRTGSTINKVVEINPGVEQERLIQMLVTDYSKFIDVLPKRGVPKWGISFDPYLLYHNRGVSYFIGGNFSKAMDDLNKVQHRAMPEDCIFRGIIYSKQGNFSQAITDFELGIKGRPVPEYYNVRAHTYVLKHDWDLAMRDYNKAIELKPNYAESYYERGYVYYLKGNLAQALNDFNKAVEYGSSETKVPYQLCPVYFEQLKHSRKISSTTRISAINPQAASVDYDNAAADLKQGDFRRAVAGFTRAIEKDPYHAKAFVRRAKAFYAQKEYDKAWEDVYTAQVLGETVDPDFIHSLKSK